MSVSLSTPIATYIAISNGADDAPLAECFTADARVLDEGQTHQGIAAIRAWLRDTRRQFEYHVAPTDVSRDGDKMVITTTVRMLHRVHRHTANLRPAVALVLVLVEGSPSLEEWFV